MSHTLARTWMRAADTSHTFAETAIFICVVWLHARDTMCVTPLLVQQRIWVCTVDLARK
jgi:hypothetical protein